LLKFFHILLIISIPFSNSIFDQSCYQAQDEMINDKEPFYDQKKDKCYVSHYIIERPIIDGILDESVWGDFDITNIDNYIHSFIQEEPNNMSSPIFDTLVKIIHDDENIYVAARLFDTNPDSVKNVLSRKDDWDRAFSDQADWFSIEFDSKHDHQSGYLFAVNAAGIQSDAVSFFDSDYDIEYNAVWDSNVSKDDYGWIVEMAIPFKMLNITQIENPWGLNIHRYIHRYNEYSSWSAMERGTPGIASQFGHIFGFKDYDVNRFLGIKPYTLLGFDKVENVILVDDQLFKDSLNYIESFDDSDFPFGLDAKLRLSQSSYLDLTINPDFGQVEMDPEYINLSFYEIYLPEKRTFFNESISMFELPIEVFYSRRIGSGNDSLDSKINYALKYIGSSESGWNLGSIVAETSEQNTTKKYFINRISKDIFNGNSIVGFLATNMFDGHRSYSSASFDNVFYFSNNLIFDYQYVKSINDKINGNAHNLNFEYDSPYPLTFLFDMESYDKNFDINKVGYNERNNIKKYKVSIGIKNTKPHLDLFRKFRWDLSYRYSENFENLNLSDTYSLIGKYYLKNYTKFSIGYILEKEHYDDFYMYDYELADNGPAFLIPESNRWLIRISTDTKKDLFCSFSYASSSSVLKDKMKESTLDVSAKLNNSSYLRFTFEQIGFNSSIDFLETVESDEDSSINHYIFSNTTGWNNRYSISYEKYFKKNISIKLFSEYFIHKNEFGEYKEWDSNINSLTETSFINGNNEYLPLYTEGSVAPQYSLIDGDIEIEQYLNPNYYSGFYPRYSNVNFNLSFKWEYDSNSEFYIVLRTSKSVNGKIFKDIGRMLSYNSEDSWTEKYFDNSIYFKFNHWFEF
tara:strand:- start:2244 stop:4811 length:2568 start_codon:yes stop_codon:yes gene_type:complete